MKELIIQIVPEKNVLTGLGDNLFYSHIPRIAKQIGGFDKVWVSSNNVPRNPDIQKLVWDLNPFIDGFIDADTNFPNTLMFNIMVSPAWKEPEMNLMDKIMLAFGLDDGFRLHRPEIYYKPNFKIEYSNKIMYDPNYVSNHWNLDTEQVSRWFRRERITLDYQMFQRGTDDGLTRSIPLDIDLYNKELKTQTIFDYTDLLYSCKHAYVLFSGTSLLSSALGKSATIIKGKSWESSWKNWWSPPTIIEELHRI